MQTLSNSTSQAGAASRADLLDDKLHASEREEQQRAMRTLLQHPLITAGGPYGVEFGFVRRHVDALREWLAVNVNWTLQVTSDFARVRKTPADLADGTRSACDAQTEAPFTRARYVLLCLGLAVLERSERQTTLGRLSDEMVEFFSADPALGASGLTLDLKGADQRRDLVHVIRFLLDRRVLRRVQGDEEAYVKDASSDVLYDIHRPVLAVMLAVRRGPSMIGEMSFDRRLAAIVEEPMPETEEGQNRQIRIRLMRRLLDDPVLYYEELDSRERMYLDSQRGLMLRRIREATGLEPEVRREGIVMLDPRGDLTDLGLPEEGTEGHLTLLIAEFFAEHLRRNGSSVVSFVALWAHTGQLIAEHRSHWRKDVGEPGAERLLAKMTLNRLASLRLVRFVEGGILPLPAVARYALAETFVVPDELGFGA